MYCSREYQLTTRFIQQYEKSTPTIISHDFTCQPLGLENEFCDIDAVQDYLLEDMVNCSPSNKPSECQKIWSIL